MYYSKYKIQAMIKPTKVSEKNSYKNWTRYHEEHRQGWKLKQWKQTENTDINAN